MLLFPLCNKLKLACKHAREESSGCKLLNYSKWFALVCGHKAYMCMGGSAENYVTQLTHQCTHLLVEHLQCVDLEHRN